MSVPLGWNDLCVIINFSLQLVGSITIVYFIWDLGRRHFKAKGFPNEGKPLKNKYYQLADAVEKLSDEFRCFKAEKELKPEPEEQRNNQERVLLVDYHVKEVDLLKTIVGNMHEGFKCLQCNIHTSSETCSFLQNTYFMKIQTELNEIRDSFSGHITSAKFAEAKQENKYPELSVNVYPEQEVVLSPRALRLERPESGSALGEDRDVHPSCFLWMISGIHDKLAGLTSHENIRCKEFSTIRKGLKFKPIISLCDALEFLCVHLEFMQDSSDQESASCLPFPHYRRYILMDQSDGPDKDNIETVDRPEFGGTFTKDTMAPMFTSPQLCFIDHLNEDSKFVKDDMIMLKIVLEPIAFVSKRTVSVDGILLWTIDNYSKKLQEEIDGRKKGLVSVPFRTSMNGYTVQVELSLVGEDDAYEGHSSISIQFILGEKDSSLTSPPRGQCTFFLIDQSEDELKNQKWDWTYSLSGPKEWVTKWRIPNFAHRNVMEDPRYLKNDSILIEIEVEMH